MKERMVTRTIINTVVNVKVYNEEIDEISATQIEIQGKFDNNELKKRCENRLAGSCLTVLKILSSKQTEKLYAMPESTFMLYAKEMPPRGNKEEEEED